MSVQVVLNAFSIGCHTLHTRPFHGLLFVMLSCVLINRINSIYLYQMFSIWLHTIGIHKIILQIQTIVYNHYEHMYIHSHIQHMNSYSYVQSCVFLIGITYVHMSIYSYIPYINACSHIHMLNITNKHMKFNCIKHNCVTTASIDDIFSCIQLFIHMY